MYKWIEELSALRQAELAMAAMAFAYIVYATTLFLILIMTV